jgi:hypothetical protein
MPLRSNGRNLEQHPAPTGKTSRCDWLRFPWFLPDGRHFLYTVSNQVPEKAALYAGDLDSKNRKLVVAANSNAVYTPSCFVMCVFWHVNILWNRYRAAAGYLRLEGIKSARNQQLEKRIAAPRMSTQLHTERGGWKLLDASLGSSEASRSFQTPPFEQ